jgi:hypothetical protein
MAIMVTGFFSVTVQRAALLLQKRYYAIKGSFIALADEALVSVIPQYLLGCELYMLWVILSKMISFIWSAEKCYDII